jgi:hypothetical protein
VGGIGLASKFAWRVFIPFYFRGEVVSFLTRGIVDEQRYRSAQASEEILDHRSLLYGEDHARHAIVICEGPTDVWAIGPGAVATCGIGYKREQVVRMAGFPVRGILYNNEPEAQRRAKKLCRELEVFPGKTFNIVPTYKDAAETMNKAPDELQLIRDTFLR